MQGSEAQGFVRCVHVRTRFKQGYDIPCVTSDSRPVQERKTRLVSLVRGLRARLPSFIPTGQARRTTGDEQNRQSRAQTAKAVPNTHGRRDAASTPQHESGASRREG